MGVVFQSYAIFPHLTVLENVAYVPGWSDTWAEAMRQPSSVLIHAWLWRPTTLEPSFVVSVLVAAKSLPKVVMTVLRRARSLLTCPTRPRR